MASSNTTTTDSEISTKKAISRTGTAGDPDISLDNPLDAGSDPVTYVRGFAIDLEKLRKLVDAEKTTDETVHQLVDVLLKKFIDMRKHWVCAGCEIGNPNMEYVGIVSLGKGSISTDLEELISRDLEVPEYLLKLASALTGPGVYRFLEW